MQDVQYTRTTINPAVYGSYRVSTENAEDNGAYYLYTPGEPIHRVDARDSVPHIYPGVVRDCTSWGHWHLASTVDIGSNIIATNLAGEKQTLVPKYAGTIRKEILDGYGYLGTVSLTAFAKLDKEFLNLDWFNAQLMPIPIFYGDDDVDPDRMEDFKRHEMVLEREALTRQHGGLGARRLQAEKFLGELIEGKYEIASSLRSVYIDAVRQILTTFDPFRVFADRHLGSADRDLKDSEKTGKSTYDARDVRLQWLLNRKGIDAALTDIMKHSQPVIQVQVPEQKEAADIERRACSECGEMIAVTAKVCRYCKTRFEEVAEETAQPKRRGRPAKVEEKEATQDDPLI